MKFRPPFWQEAWAAGQPGSAGTSHCVCQMSTESVFGEAGAARLRFASLIVIR